jgi:hypothetical protein
MTISRSQMASQLTGNKMKKKPAQQLRRSVALAAIKQGAKAKLSPAVAYWPRA